MPTQARISSMGTNGWNTSKTAGGKTMELAMHWELLVQCHDRYDITMVPDVVCGQDQHWWLQRMHCFYGELWSSNQLSCNYRIQQYQSKQRWDHPSINHPITNPISEISYSYNLKKPNTDIMGQVPNMLEDQAEDLPGWLALLTVKK